MLFEPTSCVGSDSMSLTKLFKMSYLCELNSCSLNALINNMDQVSMPPNKINYEIYGGNCFDKIRDLYTKQIPITHIYFDPPWGVSYLTNIHLSMEYKNIIYTVPSIIEVLFTIFKSIQHVFLKYPPAKELDYAVDNTKYIIHKIKYTNKKTKKESYFNLIHYFRS